MTPAQLVGVPAANPGIDFGPHLLQSSITATWQVTNVGGVSTGALSATENPDSTDFSVSLLNCPALAPGQTCNLEVTFTPQNTGMRFTSLSLAAANGSASVSVGLIGVGQREVRVGQVATLPDSLVASANFLMARPIVIERAALLTGFGITTRAEGTRVRIGLYQESGVSSNDVPSIRLAQTEAVLLSEGAREIEIAPVQVAPGNHWIVTLFDAPTTLAVDFANFQPVRHPQENTPFTMGLPVDFRSAGIVVNDAIPRENLYVVLRE